jgi:Tol biopolymer transport system component
MADLRTLIRREIERANSPSYTFDDLVRRRDRTVRNRRIAAAIVGLGIAVGSGFLFAGVLRSAPQPAQTPTPTGSVAASPSPLTPLFSMPYRVMYRSGTKIVAVDPADPDNASTLVLDQTTDLIAWSSDGSHLLIKRYPPGGCEGTFGRLFVIAADGSEVPLSTSHACSLGGSFSPDGSQIVYDDNLRLYVVDVDGSDPRRLVGTDFERGWLGYPVWSPDADRIAFNVYYEGPYKYAIDVVSSHGDGRHQIVGTGTRWPGGLSWSPNGSLLLFTTGAHSIMSVRTDGSGLRELTDGTGSSAWAPRGSRIAFARERGLFTMAVDGSDVHRVAGDLPPVSGGANARIVWSSLR